MINMGIPVFKISSGINKNLAEQSINQQDGEALIGSPGRHASPQG
jgi:hypothetical protein